MMRIFRTRARIRREAADWIARSASGLGEQDQAAFGRWRAADPRHAEAFDRLTAIWSAAGRTAPGESRSGGSTESARAPRPIALALAASLALGLALAALLLGAGSWTRGDGGAQPAALASSAGDVRPIELPDGSRLVLDANSKVEIRFGSAERRLTLLEGRARFVVARDGRPFIVRAGANEVVATGTVFDVSLRGDRLAVVLLEGSVEVRDGRGGREENVHRLAAGEELLVEPARPTVRRPVDRDEASWPSPMLEFDDVPLGEAVERVNRHGSVEIRLGDEQTRNLRVSGAYRAGDVSGFARSVASAFGLVLRTGDDGTLLLSHPGASAR